MLDYKKIKKLIKDIKIVRNFRNYFRTKKHLSRSYGQIDDKTSGGKLIYEFIQKFDIQNVLEIGTWNGLGSTLVIHNALASKDLKFSFTSIETDKIAYNYARKNLKHFPINLKLGRIIEIRDLPDPSLIDFRKHNLNPENIEWFYQDLRRYKKTKNINSHLKNQYDFIFFDGGEFSTFAEFKLLYSRTRYFGLDDIQTYKQYEVLDFINKNQNKFELIETADKLSIYRVRHETI
jgi:predicted O-methyltransferase YrrM